MAKLNAQSTYSQLPPWAKGTVVILSIVIVAGVGFALYRGIKKGIENLQENAEEREQRKELESDLEKLEKQGVKPTISDADATALVNQIKTGLDGCEMSGTEIQIKDAILQKIQNQADWVLLQQKFGKQLIDNCGLGTGDTEYDLKTLLMEQLDGFDWSFTLYSTLLVDGLKAKGINW